MKHLITAVTLSVILTSTVSAQDTVHVKTGWNIIGSVKAGAIPDILSTDPWGLIITAFFGYDPGTGYHSADTLEKGLGYWVKVRAEGIIVFDNAPPVDVCRAKAFIYENQFFNVVKIGDRCWLAQNMDVGTMIMGEATPSDNFVIEKYCYNNIPANCQIYGGLYRWDEAMQYITTPGSQGICPYGWHIPTKDEYQALASIVGDDGNALKTVGQGSGSGVGTNTSGFSGLLAGRRELAGAFFFKGDYGNFWSSVEYDGGSAFHLHLNSADSDISLNFYNKAYGSSVRCIED